MNPKILIIDDEKSICESLAFIFEEKGYFVETAYSGNEAVQKTKNFEYDAVLIDIMLPDANGLNLLRNFKVKYPDMVCIIITATNSLQNAIKAIKEGADGYFTKPPIMDEVIFRVEEALEKRQLRLEIKKSEEKFKKIFESIPDLYFLVSEDTTILEYKGKEEDLYIAPEELVGRKLLEILPEDLAISSYECIKKTIKTEQPQILEYSLFLQDQKRYFEARHLNLSKNNVAIFIRDISERKKTEKINTIQRELALKMLETDNITEIAHIFIEAILNVTDFDACGIYILNNTTKALDLAFHKGFSQLFIQSVSHYNHESQNIELAQIDKPIFLNYGDLNLRKTEAMNLEGLKSVAIIPIIYQGSSIGCIYIASHKKEIIPETTKKISEILVGQIGQTISRLLMSSTLKESEKKYRLITENANDIICVLSNKFKLEYINEQVQKKIMGYSEGELIGMDVLKLVHPDDILNALKSFKQDFNKQKGIIELRLKKKDGTYIWLELMGKIFTDFDGKEKLLAIGRDISEKIKSEKKIKESEEKYRFLVESINDLIIEADINGDIIYISPQINQLLGYDVEELINENIIDFVHPEDIQFISELIFNVDMKESYPIILEFRLKHKNGQYLTVQVSSTKREKDGNLSVIGVIRDISEIKAAEIKLRESEEKYRNLFEKAIVGIVAMIDGKIVMCNDQEANFFGYSSASDLMGKNVLKLIYPDDLSILEKIQDEVFKGKGMEHPVIFRGIHKSGKDLIIEGFAIKFPFLSENCILAYNIDVTQRELSQQKIKESEEKYRLITENANDLIIIVNKENQFEYINEETHKRLLGYSKKDLIGKFSFDFLHPEDLKKAQFAMTKGIEQGDATGELRLRDVNGGYTWFEMRGAKFVNTKKEEKIIIVGRDISERKQAEEEIKESEEKFRNISEQSLMGINIIQNGFIKYVNKAAASLFEYSEEEILNWNFEEFSKTIHPEDYKFVIEQARKKQAGHKDVIDHYSYRVITKKGKIKWVDQFSKSIIYKKKPADLVTLLDISEKKSVENELNRYRKQLEQMVEDRTAELVISNKKLEQEIIDRKVIEKRLYRQYSILNAINKIFQETLIRDKEEDVASTCLNLATELTNSEFGFIGEINQKNLFDIIALSNPGWYTSEVEKLKSTKMLKNLEIRGIWGNVINEEKSLIIKKIYSHLDSVIIPQVHRPLVNFLGVPLKMLGKTIGIIALGNKKTDFTNDDKDAVESLSIAFVEALIRKKMESELRRSEEKFKSITNISQELIVRADLNGNCTFINPAAAIFFQKSIEEMMGAKFTDYIHPEDIEHAARALSEIVITGEPVLGFHTKIIVPSGIRTVKWNGSVIRDNKGRIIGLQASGRDVTELQEELIEKNKLAAVGQLAAGVAHELNTPLANINLTAEYILNLMKKQKISHEWQILTDEIMDIKKQVMLCSKIVKDLLQFSRKMAISIKNVELNSILNESLSSPSISKRLKDKQIELITEMENIIQIEADKSLILQVFQNIINNAIDATSEGDKNPQIKIKLSKIDSKAEIKVIDNGKGIKESDLGRIFDPFFSTKPVGKGTGLGLAICRSIIEKHGGKINIQSIYGEGTDVTINLPLKQLQNSK